MGLADHREEGGMKRAYLGKTAKADIMRAQGWRCGCGCGAAVWPGSPVEWDHTLPLALGGTAKPDAALTPWCHARKTFERDIPMVSKADRQGKAHRGEKQAKRPFRKPPEGYRYQWPSRKVGA